MRSLLTAVRQFFARVLPPIFLALLVAVPLATLIWLVFFTRTFAVQTVTIVDARPHTTQQARETLETVVGKNILFLQADVLEDRLQSILPQVRTVHIVRKLPGTLKVIIQEKEPRVLLLAGGRYYFVDDEGRVYEEARLDTLPGVVLPTIKVNDPAAAVQLGARAMEGSLITFIQTVQAQLPAAAGAEVVEIRIPSLAAREVHFHLLNNWQIRFDSTRPAEPQLAVLRQVLTETVTATEKARLVYIDLRIPNRVYYKTSDGDIPIESPRPGGETLPQTSGAAATPSPVAGQ